MKNHMINRQQNEQMEWTFFIYIFLHFPFSYIVFVVDIRTDVYIDQTKLHLTLLSWVELSLKLSGR